LPTLAINSFCAAIAPAVGGPVTLALNLSIKLVFGTDADFVLSFGLGVIDFTSSYAIT
jgi:hypothetical protein